MKKRAKSAQHTEEKILNGLYYTWIEGSLREITLEKVAEKSGVTVRTILRKFGSKEGLFEAALKGDIAGINDLKSQTITGDLDSIMSTLMTEYEETGMAGIRTLALEYELEHAAKILKKGRMMHKAWVERVFKSFLPENDPQKRHEMKGALYVETDINCWKLLRIDLGYSVEETEAIMRKKIEGTIYAYTNNL